MSDGIFISMETFGKFAPSTQIDIRSVFFGQDIAERVLTTATALAGTDKPETVQPWVDDRGLINLNIEQVREMTTPMSERTIQALRFIAAQNEPRFTYADLVAHIGPNESTGRISGVLAALTKRAKAVAANGIFISWSQDGTHIATISKQTHAMLRRHFSLD